MSPAGLMSALGVTEYKTDPARRSFDQKLALAEKYGLMAGEKSRMKKLDRIARTRYAAFPMALRWETTTSIPVKVDISFHEGLITEIVVQFSEMNWDACCRFLTRSTEPIGPPSAAICRSLITRRRNAVGWRELSLNTSPRARSQAQKTIAKYGQQTSTSCSSTTMHLGLSFAVRDPTDLEKLLTSAGPWALIPQKESARPLPSICE